MLFTFQTMYLGLSPFDAPWVYSVLTYMEYGEGIRYPMGGLSSINEAVAKLASKKGVVIRTECEVAAIDVNSVILANGDVVAGDVVISNADLPYTEQNLQSEQPEERRYSCSAYCMYMSYKGKLPNLLHHNIFFGPDFRANLTSIFHPPLQMPPNPAFYCCISAKTEPERAKAGYENVFVLVPCPNLDHKLTEEERNDIESYVYKRLGRASGFHPSKIEAQLVRTPEIWRDEYNLDKGSTFGLSHDFRQSVCFRPSNRSKSNPWLYYVGASTVPGNGLPMVLISAELVEKRLLEAKLLGRN
jgi:phytoene desaturase